MDRAIFVCGSEPLDLTPAEGWAADRFAFLDAKEAAEAFIAENWSDYNFDRNVVYVLNCLTKEVTAWSVDVELIAVATARPLDGKADGGQG